MSNPEYNIGDVVYLIESAKVGSLESYTISSIRQDANGVWYYNIAMPSRPVRATTVGDQNNLQHDVAISLTGDQLTDYCTAVETIETYFQMQLVRIQALKAARCPNVGS